MDVALYTSDRGTLVLVPACMLPTQEAERLYGPLRLCARTEVPASVDARFLARIEQEIDRNAYALLSVHEAKGLLGLRKACARKRSIALWPRIHRRRSGNTVMHL